MARKTRMTKDEVIAEIRRLQGEGHSMKYVDFSNVMKYSIRDIYGGYKELKTELGIKTEYKMTQEALDVRRKAAATRTIPEERLVEVLRKNAEDSMYIGDLYKTLGGGVKGAIVKRYGGLHKFAEKHDIKLPPKKDTREWTEERIESELRKIYDDNGKMPSMRWIKENGNSTLVEAVKRNYGTWNEGISHFGYKPFYVAGKTDWTAEELIERALGEIGKGCEPTGEGLNERIRGFRHQVSRLFGSYDEFKRQAGYCVISTDRPTKEKPVSNYYRASLRTKNGFKRELIRLWYVGAPLNYQAIKEKRCHLIGRARDLFGGWRTAIEYCGIDYGSIRMADNSLSEAGVEFEELLGDILAELGVRYEKYAHETLEPDFVLPGNEWIDAKLSEWTDCSDMLKRYLPECAKLTIVYLRGSKTDRFVGTKYRHRKLSVFKLTEQLSEDRRYYYEEKLNEIGAEVQAA